MHLTLFNTDSLGLILSVFFTVSKCGLAFGGSPRQTQFDIPVPTRDFGNFDPGIQGPNNYETPSIIGYMVPNFNYGRQINLPGGDFPYEHSNEEVIRLPSRYHNMMYGRENGGMFMPNFGGIYGDQRDSPNSVAQGPSHNGDLSIESGRNNGKDVQDYVPGPTTMAPKVKDDDKLSDVKKGEHNMTGFPRPPQKPPPLTIHLRTAQVPQYNNYQPYNGDFYNGPPQHDRRYEEQFSGSPMGMGNMDPYQSQDYYNPQQMTSPPAGNMGQYQQQGYYDESSEPGYSGGNTFLQQLMKVAPMGMPVQMQHIPDAFPDVTDMFFGLEDVPQQHHNEQLTLLLASQVTNLRWNDQEAEVLSKFLTTYFPKLLHLMGNHTKYNAIVNDLNARLGTIKDIKVEERSITFLPKFAAREFFVDILRSHSNTSEIYESLDNETIQDVKSIRRFCSAFEVVLKSLNTTKLEGVTKNELYNEFKVTIPSIFLLLKTDTKQFDGFKAAIDTVIGAGNQSKTSTAKGNSTKTNPKGHRSFYRYFYF